MCFGRTIETKTDSNFQSIISWREPEKIESFDALSLPFINVFQIYGEW